MAGQEATEQPEDQWGAPHQRGRELEGTLGVRRPPPCPLFSYQVFKRETLCNLEGGTRY